MSTLRFLSASMLGIVASTCVFAQDPINVEVSSVQGLPGQTVEVEISFFGNNDARNIDMDLQISDLTGFSANDASSCGDNVDADLGSCQVLAAPNDDTLRYGFINAADPMASCDPCGTWSFTIDAGATVGDIYTIDLVQSNFENDPVVNFTAGQIEVIDVPPEDLSELSVTPDPLAFGTIDLGNMPVTDTVTAENTGGSNSSLTISGVVYSGDTEFSVVNDACTGSTLNFGDTCDVTVEFNAGANGNYTGQLDFSSDANTNPNPTVSITGAADSVPNLTVNPPFGPVNLGTGLQGSTVSANGSISNSGSAPGDFDCTLNDPNGVYSTSPSPLAGTVPAGGSVDFTLSCTLPDAAEDGDTFAATLSCTGDITGTHDLSCGVSEFEPLPVPTMQKWGLIVLTLMMLMIGGLSIRFFRA